MYVVDTEIDFEKAPIEFYRWPHPPGGLRRILHHHIQGTLPSSHPTSALLYALGTDREAGGEQAAALRAYCVGLPQFRREVRSFPDTSSVLGRNLQKAFL